MILVIVKLNCYFIFTFLHHTTLFKPQSRQSAKLFLQSSQLGLPQPLTRRRVCPPPLVPGGGAHALAGERGGGSVPIHTRRHTCDTLYICCICTLWFKRSTGPKLTGGSTLTRTEPDRRCPQRRNYGLFRRQNTCRQSPARG
jgi:hypothetical protein